MFFLCDSSVQWRVPVAVNTDDVYFLYFRYNVV